MWYVFLIITFVFSCIHSVSARRAPRAVARVQQQDLAAPAEVKTPDIERHTGQYRDVDALVERAQRDAEYVKRAAEREKEALESKVRRNQSRLERKRQELLQKDTERQLRLEEQARRDAEIALKQADEKARAIVIEAEKKAQELKASIQQQDAQDREAGRAPIKREWRKEIIKDYEKDVGFIRQVIMEGEVSRVERQNFIALFTEQQEWLRAKIEEAQFFFDEAYNAVIAKKNAMAALVDAQKQADDLVLDLVNEYHFPAQVQAHLRLMALYEINNHLQHTEHPTLFIPADVIENLVTKIGVDVLPGKREITIVTEKEKVGTLQARITELETKLAEEDAAEKERKEAELAALKKEKEAADARIAAAETAYEEKQAEIARMCEAKQREKIELQLILAKVHEQIAQIRAANAGVISELAGQLEKQQLLSKELGGLLEAKQKETTILTVQTHSLQRAMNEALEHAAAYARQHEVVQHKAAERDKQIEDLQAVIARITESQVEVSTLMNRIAEQQEELTKRRNAYAKMQKLEAKLEKARQARKASKEQSAEHLRMLAQVNEYGARLLSDYKRVQLEAHNAHHVNVQLAHLLSSLRAQGENTLSRTEVVQSLDQALALLQQQVPHAIAKPLYSAAPVHEPAFEPLLTAPSVGDDRGAVSNQVVIPHPGILEDAFSRGE